MNMNDYRNMPGPGDAATWGAYDGHPMDPRNPELDSDEPTIEELIIMEADAILAECQTVAGAQKFADVLADTDCHVSASLVSLVQLANEPNRTTHDHGRILETAMRVEAMRQAAQRVMEFA